jgi:7-cyano-7-deazaguanine synthase
MPTAVLLSGGLDSAVLLADEASRASGDGGGAVQPIYVSVGLAWEPAERAAVARLLETDPIRDGVRPLVALSVDMRDVYEATHWAVEGRPPGYHTPDEDVYLPGRNVILLGKAAVFCAAAHIDRIVVGTLGHNPFPDATPVFRSAMATALSLGLGHALQIDAPFADASKADVVRRGAALRVPFTLTVSCMNPRPVTAQHLASATGFHAQTDRSASPAAWLHCGLCSKCRERHDGFLEAAVADPTVYADGRFVSA